MATQRSILSTVLVAWLAFTAICTENETYSGDGFEVARTIVRNRHDAGIHPIENENLSSVSKEFRQEIYEKDSYFKMRKYRNAIRETCPRSVKEKIFRDLFHPKPPTTTIPSEGVDTFYHTLDFERYFEEMDATGIDACLDSVSAYCEAGGHDKSKYSRLNVAINFIPGDNCFARNSALKLFTHCPVKVYGNYGNFLAMSGPEFNGILEHVKGVEIFFENQHLKAEKLFPKVDDLTLTIQDYYDSETYAKISKIFDLDLIRSLNFKQQLMTNFAPEMVSELASIIKAAKNLKSLTCSVYRAISVAPIIDAAPSTLEELDIYKPELKNEEVASLIALFNRAQNNLKKLTLHGNLMNLELPSLPVGLKYLRLMSSYDIVHPSIMSNLNKSKHLEKLESTIALRNIEFYSHVPKSVKELHVGKDFESYVDNIEGILAQLDTLIVSGVYFTKPQVSISKILQFKNIETLAFKRCAFDDFDFGIENQSSIKSLVIESTMIMTSLNEAKASSLIASLQKMPKLRWFSFMIQGPEESRPYFSRTIQSVADLTSVKFADFVHLSGNLLASWFGISDYFAELKDLWNKKKDMVIIGQ